MVPGTERLILGKSDTGTERLIQGNWGKGIDKQQWYWETDSLVRWNKVLQSSEKGTMSLVLWSTAVVLCCTVEKLYANTGICILVVSLEPGTLVQWYFGAVALWHRGGVIGAFYRISLPFTVLPSPTWALFLLSDDSDWIWWGWKVISKKTRPWQMDIAQGLQTSLGFERICPGKI